MPDPDKPQQPTSWPIAFAMSTLFVTIGAVICFMAWALTR